jgi:hypothetical protein
VAAGGFESSLHQGYPPLTACSCFFSARRFHFSSLAHDNSSLHSEVISTVPGEYPAPSLVHGLQRIAKYNLSETEADDVDVYLALWRIPHRNSDLVLSVNAPRGKTRDAQEGERVWREAATSLKIVNMGLFA